MRNVVWSGFVLAAACSGSEQNVSSSVGACELSNVDAVCAASTQSVTANASIAFAPDVIAGVTYEIAGPGNGKRGYVIFTPSISGSHTLYFGDQEPIRVCDEEPTCGSPVTQCAPFHRAAQYEMVAGLPHEIEIRPTGVNKKFVLHIDAPDEQPPGGDVKLAPAQTFVLADYPDRLSAADLDGDQDLDLVISNSNDAGGIASIVLVRGSGTGQFATVREMQTSNPDETAVHDWSGDGFPDIAGIAHDGQGPLPTFYFESIGSFLYDDSVRWGGGRDFKPSLGMGDFNEDGVPDLVAAHVDTVNFPDGPAGFVIFSMPSFTVIDSESGFGITTRTAVAGDFNGDGNQDVLVGDEQIGRVRLYTGNGSGGVTFAAEQGLTDSGVSRIEVLDLDGDGDDDFVSIHRDGTAMAVRNTTGFAASRQTLDLLGHLPSAAVGDFDRDGFTDLAVGVHDSSADRWFVQLYMGTATLFDVGPELALPPLSASDLVTGDFNGDNFVDLVATTEGGVVVFFSTP